MSEFEGAYLGFSYGKNAEGNPMHSSDLGIVRTSDGSRFNENLLPTIQDKTVQVPGGDGTYYFGSYYTQRQFTIPFAFNGLTEEQVRQLRTHFGDKKIHDLVFDEAPYKTYRAKVTGTAQIKHLVFDEGEGKERVYKGEGSIQFTCYQPYAICKKKWLNEYAEEGRNEWAVASGLKSEQGGYDKVVSAVNGGNLTTWNPGDIPAPVRLGFKFDANGKIPAGSITNKAQKSLHWDEMVAQLDVNKNPDTAVWFDSKLNLIEGYRQVNGKWIKTGHVYNKHITDGEFFPLAQNEDVLTLSSNIRSRFFDVDYQYYYL